MAVVELPSPAPAPGEAQSLALALVNTQILSRGEEVDLLPDAQALRTWLRAHDLAAPAASSIGEPQLQSFRALRSAVRDVFLSRLNGTPARRSALTTINDAAAASPSVPRLSWSADGPDVTTDSDPKAPALDVARATIAGSAIDTVMGEQGDRLRTCDAHNCIRLFIQDHGRRQWCSKGCGDRVRFARYYRKSHPET